MYYLHFNFDFFPMHLTEHLLYFMMKMNLFPKNLKVKIYVFT
jgi:hypothetical protein